jgi:hypothetical protein
MQGTSILNSEISTYLILSDQLKSRFLEIDEETLADTLEGIVLCLQSDYRRNGQCQTGNFWKETRAPTGTQRPHPDRRHADFQGPSKACPDVGF